MKHTDFMQEALKEAKKAYALGEIPVGCVIVHGDRIVARAHNQTETLLDPTAHAEMIAITQAASELGYERLTKAIVYVTKEPCPMCAGALVLARIKRLYYGIKDVKAGSAGTVFNLTGSDRLNHRIKVEGGILEKESLALLHEFFRTLRKEKR